MLAFRYRFLTWLHWMAERRFSAGRHEPILRQKRRSQEKSRNEKNGDGNLI